MSPSLSVKQSSLFIGQTITLIPSNPIFFLTAQEEVCKGEKMNYSCMTMLGLLFHQWCIVETLGNKVLLETFFCAGDYSHYEESSSKLCV